jgi:hypothetical protein
VLGSPVSASRENSEIGRLQEDWNSFCLIENIQEELCLTTTLMERALDQKTRKKTKMSKACRNMCPEFGHHVRITWNNKLRRPCFFLANDIGPLLANIGKYFTCLTARRKSKSWRIRR